MGRVAKGGARTPLDLPGAERPAPLDEQALLQVVLDGGGLPEVAATLATLLGGLAVVTTPDGRVLARGGTPPADGSAETWFDGTGRLRTEALDVGAARRPSTARPLSARVVAGSLDHGRVAVMGAHRRLGAALVVERAAAVAGLVIAHQLAIGAVEDKYRGDFVRDLLAGRAGTAAEAAEHAASLGWDVGRPLVVLVAELDPAPGPVGAGDHALALRPAQERFATGWRTVVGARDAVAPVAGFNQEVVTLVGRPRDGDVERAVRELVRAVSGDGGGGRRSFTTGVSRLVVGVEALPAAYEQARRAVRVGRQLRGPGSVVHFDQLGAMRLLSLLPDSAEVDAFVDETLGELARDGDPEVVDLRRTLQALLDANLNVAETARALHFHYNTLRYRIGKLERMLGPFTTDPGLRLDLALALQVVRLRHA